MSFSLMTVQHFLAANTVVDSFSSSQDLSAPGQTMVQQDATRIGESLPSPGQGRIDLMQRVFGSSNILCMHLACDDTAEITPEMLRSERGGVAGVKSMEPLPDASIPLPGAAAHICR